MYRFVILANEIPGDHLLWVKACEKYKTQVSCRVVNLMNNSWLEEIRKEPVDCLLAKPGGFVDQFKQVYDERLRILVNDMGYKVYPTLDEILVYENKRYLSFWLDAHNIPHPGTNVFYDKKDALNFVQSSTFPLVAKLNIGASGNGVVILKTREQAIEYTNTIFTKGIGSRTGPKLEKGRLLQRAMRKLLHPEELKNKLKTYHNVSSNPQRGFCIFQEFIPHTFEWRVVRIGESYFAHKKIVKGEKASGSLIKGYDNPPLSLFDFVREITTNAGFRSQAVDVFETGNNTYLVNEMQCIFGQSDPYQMLIDGKPGRYLLSDGKWIFEEGMFNTNESYDLRVEDAINLLNSEK